MWMPQPRAARPTDSNDEENVMADSMTHPQPTIVGRVIHDSQLGPEQAGVVANATVTLHAVDAVEAKGARASRTDRLIGKTVTDEDGRFEFNVTPGSETYIVRCHAFGLVLQKDDVHAPEGGGEPIVFDLQLGFLLSSQEYTTDQRIVRASRAVVGRRLVMRAGWTPSPPPQEVRWKPPAGAGAIQISDFEVELIFARAGRTRIEAVAEERAGSFGSDPARARTATEIVVSEPEVQAISGHVGVTLQRTGSEPTLDQALWVAIRNRTGAISFSRYRAFINNVLGWDRTTSYSHSSPVLERHVQDLSTHLHGVGAYKVLRTATEIFLLCECGVRLDNCRGEILVPDLLDESARLGERVTLDLLIERLDDYLGTPKQLPYLRRVVEAAFPELERAVSARDRVVLSSRVHEPCLLELIWSYWHEEGMLMQTMNAISQRFQNIRRLGDRDPLLNLEIDPLRPVNNLLWGFIQDEQNRLSVGRRGYEYLHEYGLAIYGKAAPIMPAAADVRSKFLEAFHNLLHQSSIFFKEDFQTTVIADGFPLLNALKEVHLILAQGAHNQFGDLPWTARSEMLVAQYILARPEIRDFLQSRVMVPYKEPWMAQVDMMKTIQGWPDVTVTHFRDLGVFGEQLLLSIRYGDWIDVNDENAAKNWARYWRSEIQGYMHAYRAATGIDLTNADTVDATVPALLEQKRLR
jgi:hypothetical protein